MEGGRGQKVEGGGIFINFLQIFRPFTFTFKIHHPMFFKKIIYIV